MYERSEISAWLLVTEVQTLHQQLNAARDNSDNLQKQLQHQKQSFRIADKSVGKSTPCRRKESVQRQILRRNFEGEVSDRLSDAALKSDKSCAVFPNSLPGHYL